MLCAKVLLLSQGIWFTNVFTVYPHIGGLMQERCNPIANALELLLSCINPSICIKLTFCTTSVENIIQLHFLTIHYYLQHDDVIKWKQFPRYWPFVWGIHRSPVNSPHKGQWHGALMFSLISAWINAWVNNHEAGDLGRHPAHYDVIVMKSWNVAYESIIFWRVFMLDIKFQKQLPNRNAIR